MLREISVSRQYAPLRVCADICFYFFAVSLFSFSVTYSSPNGEDVQGLVTNLIAPWSRQLFVLVAACLAVGFAAVRVKSLPLRLLLSLLPGLSFLMSPFQPILLIHAAAWVYFVIFMTVGSFEAHLDEYRRRAGVMLFVTLMLTLCLIIFHFGTDDWYNRRLFGGEICGALFFVFCVLSLRGMRTELGAPKTMRLLDAAYVVALPTLLVSAFFLLRTLVPAVTFLFRQLTRFLLWLRRLLFPQEAAEYIPPPDSDDVNTLMNENKPPMLTGGGEAVDPDVFNGKNLRLQLSDETAFWLMIVFLAAALIFIAIMLLRRRRKGAGEPRPVYESIEKTPLEGLLRRSLRESVLNGSVRQIRRIYRAYLSHIRALSVKISPSDTSEDVLALSSEYLDLPENAALRELYIAARYGDPKAVGPEQVGRAKRCLAAIDRAKAGAAK
jgi:hypothetical protein